MNKTQNQPKKSREKIIKLCIIAVMAALLTVLDLFSIDLQFMKLSLSGIPILFASFVLGPLAGGIVGGIGSLLSQIVHYGFSVTTVFWILPHIMRGLSAGFLFYVFKKQPKIFSISISTIVSSLVMTAFNTFAMYMDFKILGADSYYTIGGILGIDLLTRIGTAFATSIVYIIVMIPILNVIKSLKIFND